MVFLRRKGWEYVEHRTAPEAAMIVAITPDDEIVLAEEFRLPMNAPVLSLPAGLDRRRGAGGRRWTPRAGSSRRRPGYAAPALEAARAGPGLRRAELGDDDVLPGARRRCAPASRPRTTSARSASTSCRSPSCPRWARAREAEGAVVDPKIWAGLYLAGRR